MKSTPNVFLLVCISFFSLSLVGLGIGIVAITTNANIDWASIILAAAFILLSLAGCFLLLKNNPEKESIKPLAPTPYKQPNPLIATEASHQAPSFANYLHLKTLMSAHQQRYTQARYSQIPSVKESKKREVKKCL